MEPITIKGVKITTCNLLDTLGRPKLPREKDFQKEVLKLAKAFGWRAAHFSTGMTKNGSWLTLGSGDYEGFPDVVMSRGGDIAYVELKRDEDDLTDKQIEWMMRLLDARQECCVWTPWDWPRIPEILEHGFGHVPATKEYRDFVETREPDQAPRDNEKWSPYVKRVYRVNITGDARMKSGITDAYLRNYNE